MVAIADFYKPHAGQAVVNASHAQWKVLEVARRWGKSRSALGELLANYTEALGKTRSKDLVPAYHAWIIVPSFPQGRQVWNEMMQIIPKEFIDRAQQGEKVIYLRGGSRWNGGYGFIELKSADDPNALQSTGLDFLWLCESQDISDAAFIKVVPTIVSPGRMGRVFAEGIPSLYPDHWFRKLYVTAESYMHEKSSIRQRKYFAFKATYLDNPLLTAGQKEEIEVDHKELMTQATWERMYLAVFSQNAGYFRNIQECISGDLFEIPLPGTRYVCGIDLGRRRDYTVVTILDPVNRQVAGHFSFDPKYSWPEQQRHIIAIQQEWGIERMVLDSTGVGDVIYEGLLEAGLPVEPFTITGDNRTALLEDLAVSLERETIHFPPIPALLRQLRAFQFRRTARGNWRAEHPPGEHDDEIFALALGLTACDEPHTVMPRTRVQSRRYVPTQSEAVNGGIRSGVGERIIRERSEARRRERYDRWGVHV